MGNNYVDQYSLLHAAVGIILYFWNVSFGLTALIHTLFELGENTPLGMRLINTFFVGTMPFQWPGKKERADHPVNMVTDTIFCLLGWWIAQQVDKYYSSQ